MKVGDFGLCKALKHGNQQMTGDTGTKRYMAPEVHRNDTIYSVKADIYSGALILWLMNTGGVPYSDCVVNSIGQKVSLEHHRPPVKNIQWAEFRDIIVRGWAPLAMDRPEASEILEQLDNLPGKPTEKELMHMDRMHQECACVVS